MSKVISVLTGFNWGFWVVTTRVVLCMTLVTI